MNSWITFSVEMSRFEHAQERVSHTETFAHYGIDILDGQNTIGNKSPSFI